MITRQTIFGRYAGTPELLEKTRALEYLRCELDNYYYISITKIRIQISRICHVLPCAHEFIYEGPEEKMAELVALAKSADLRKPGEIRVLHG